MAANIYTIFKSFNVLFYRLDSLNLNFFNSSHDLIFYLLNLLNLMAIE